MYALLNGLIWKCLGDGRVEYREKDSNGWTPFDALFI